MTCDYFHKCNIAIELLNRKNLSGETKILYEEKCNGNGGCGIHTSLMNQGVLEGRR